MQIANFGDYCNECGNCDTFCPEYGGPFIKKPTFFSRLEEFEQRRDHDGFFTHRSATHDIIHGRIEGEQFLLRVDRKTREACYLDGIAETHLDSRHAPIRSSLIKQGVTTHTVNMRTYHTLRLLMEGVFDKSRLNPINFKHINK